jgi:predicted Fe-Mo cluster-binding NifX family protein
MKIAVAAYQKSQTSEISVQAGRAPFFLIFDERGALLEILKNPFSVGGGGAGFGVAKMLGDKQVQVVIAGKFGSNMIDSLKEKGIHTYEMKGIAKEALANIKETEG